MTADLRRRTQDDLRFAEGNTRVDSLAGTPSLINALPEVAKLAKEAYFTFEKGAVKAKTQNLYTAATAEGGNVTDVLQELRQQGSEGNEAADAIVSIQQQYEQGLTKRQAVLIGGEALIKQYTNSNPALQDYVVAATSNVLGVDPTGSLLKIQDSMAKTKLTNDEKEFVRLWNATPFKDMNQYRSNPKYVQRAKQYASEFAVIRDKHERHVINSAEVTLTTEDRLLEVAPIYNKLADQEILDVTTLTEQFLTEGIPQLDDQGQPVQDETGSIVKLKIPNPATDPEGYKLFMEEKRPLLEAQLRQGLNDFENKQRLLLSKNPTAWAAHLGFFTEDENGAKTADLERTKKWLALNGRVVDQLRPQFEDNATSKAVIDKYKGLLTLVSDQEAMTKVQRVRDIISASNKIDIIKHFPELGTLESFEKILPSLAITHPQLFKRIGRFLSNEVLARSVLDPTSDAAVNTQVKFNKHIQSNPLGLDTKESLSDFGKVFTGTSGNESTGMNLATRAYTSAYLRDTDAFDTTPNDPEVRAKVVGSLQYGAKNVNTLSPAQRTIFYNNLATHPDLAPEVFKFLPPNAADSYGSIIQDDIDKDIGILDNEMKRVGGISSINSTFKAPTYTTEGNIRYGKGLSKKASLSSFDRSVKKAEGNTRAVNPSVVESTVSRLRDKFLNEARLFDYPEMGVLDDAYAIRELRKLGIPVLPDPSWTDKEKQEAIAAMDAAEGFANIRYN